MYKLFILIYMVFLGITNVTAQICFKQGQTPSLAIPVCGTTVFKQDSVSLCNGKSIPVPPCGNGTDYTDKNPFWYKFHCFTTGTLGFLIIPSVISEDYDWQLFDVTGKNPNDVYTNASLFVSCNWSGVTGTTGTISGTTAVNSCSSSTDPTTGTPNKTAMPTLIVGHDYLLMVSHYTDTQYGYGINFSGGTAGITDPLLPQINGAKAICDGTNIFVVFNKKMRCSTIDANGSCFSLNPPKATIVSAVGYCNGGFDTDSVKLTVNQPLTPGSYTILAQIGNDGNTVSDICGNNIPVGDSAKIQIYPLIPTPFDSITKPDSCSPKTLQLVFKKPIQCASIAPDGSNFIITGPSNVQVINARGICDANNQSYTIIVTLQQPIFTGGIYSIKLIKGSNGNTIIDECNIASIPNQSLNFYVKQSVLAKFLYQIKYSCQKTDTVIFFHNGANGVTNWKWTFNDGSTANTATTNKIYTTPGGKQVLLRINNNECYDTSTSIIPIQFNEYKASFDATPFICPSKAAFFTNTSTGNILDYFWTFDNGNSSNLKNPPSQTYTFGKTEISFLVKLIIQDTTHGLMCYDSATQAIKAVPNCYIAVPSAFTPNGDGKNDYLYPLNAYTAKDLRFMVYNRYGQKVFETTNWQNKWDGTFNGEKQTPNTYVWILEYTDFDTQKRIVQKGTTVLIR